MKIKEKLLSIYSTYSHLFIPRWLVLLFDLAVIFFAYFTAIILRLNLDLIEFNLKAEIPFAILVAFVYFISFSLYRSYSGIIRHTGLNDAYRIFQATGTAFISLVLIGITTRYFSIPVPWTTSFAALLIHFLLSYFVLMGFRIVVKTTITRLTASRKSEYKNVLIYGAGLSGIITRNALNADPRILYDIVAFVDDNPNKANKMLEGVPVLPPEEVLNEKYIEKTESQIIIIAIQNLDLKKRADIIEKSIDLGLELKVVPPIDNWINGELSVTQLKDVNIEQLLEREPIKLDNLQVASDLFNKTVLISGAAGSIGSEITRQVLQYQPEKLLLLDQAESALFDLVFELKNHNKLGLLGHKVIPIIADINDEQRMDSVFKSHCPEVVFHAAAYKHVPLMEDNPYEAVLINVLGTQTIADLAVKYEARKFVMISTDKAVNPTNVMGASKRIAEIYTQSISNEKTQFITTRFGNVLGSSGSVIPIFKKQIDNGGPITITHKDIIRYFMTIPEACNLVLEAGSMGKGSEIFIFDMGQPVKILDLANKMIRLSGLIPEKDIKIIETGLRPGEKLFEELLSNKENTIPTYHPKILTAKVEPLSANHIKTQIEELKNILRLGDNFDIVKKMKDIVPEFVSNNSPFSILDSQKFSN